MVLRLIPTARVTKTGGVRACFYVDMPLPLPHHLTGRFNWPERAVA